MNRDDLVVELKARPSSFYYLIGRLVSGRRDGDGEDCASEPSEASEGIFEILTDARG